MRRLLIAGAMALVAASSVHAMRIVSLAPSVTETVFALGAGQELVGVSTYCDFPPEAASVDKVGTFLSPSAEVIVAKRPDVVIGVPSPNNRASVEALERVGLKVVIVDPETLAGIEKATQTIAVAIGREQEGVRLLERMRGEIAATRSALAGVTPRRALMVVGHAPLVAVGRGVFLDELMVMAGGSNVAAGAGGQWPHLSLEFVIAQAPEVIVDTTLAHQGDSGAGGPFWAALRSVPAVRDERVFGYRDYTLLRPGPRVGEALLVLARFFHPEQFAATPGR